MVNIQLNQLVKKQQIRRTLLIGAGLLGLMTIIIIIHQAQKTSKKTIDSSTTNLTGRAITPSFTEKNEDNALIHQQADLADLKETVKQLTLELKKWKKEVNSQIKNKEVPKSMVQEEKKLITHQASLNELPATTQQNQWAFNTQSFHPSTSDTPRTWIKPVIHSVSFRQPQHIKHHHQSSTHQLNPNHYVPSNTSVRAIVLGGADADASVNGQTRNNGVMLFKLIDNGTLPNGQHSHLSGCRISANAYGDISSERAFATLYRLSCAYPGQPIIDKAVTGWVFFNGKVGIKGQPLMRDNKIMQWAGVSGALSGLASVAQYAQSIQQISNWGVNSVLPSNRIAPFAAYGGASKAADTLSNYYIKRAEQYHPVIQVGAGNAVTIVFKDGFYLSSDEDKRSRHHSRTRYHHAKNKPLMDSSSNDFSVPSSVLKQLDSNHWNNNNEEGNQSS